MAAHPSVDLPRIDVDRIAEELRLAERARENGSRELPASGDESLDAAQTEVAARIRQTALREIDRRSSGIEAIERRPRPGSRSRYSSEIRDTRSAPADGPASTSP